MGERIRRSKLYERQKVFKEFIAPSTCQLVVMETTTVLAGVSVAGNIVKTNEFTKITDVIEIASF